LRSVELHALYDTIPVRCSEGPTLTLTLTLWRPLTMADRYCMTQHEISRANTRTAFLKTRL